MRNESVGGNKVSGIDFVLKLFQSAPSQNRDVVVRAQPALNTRSEFGVASLLGKPQERGRLPEKIALARHSKHSRLQAVRNSDSVPWRKYENTYKASFVLARMPPGGAPATSSSIRP